MHHYALEHLINVKILIINMIKLTKDPTNFNFNRRKNSELQDSYTAGIPLCSRVFNFKLKGWWIRKERKKTIVEHFCIQEKWRGIEERIIIFFNKELCLHAERFFNTIMKWTIVFMASIMDF